MNGAQRRAFDEAVQRFDAERELLKRETAFGVEAAFAQSFELIRQRVLGAVDDAQVVAATKAS